MTSGELTQIEAVPGSGNSQMEGYWITGERDLVAAYGPWWDDFRVSAVVDSTVPVNRNSAHAVNSQSRDRDRPAAGLVFRLTGYGYYAAFLSGNRKGKDLSLRLVKVEYGDKSEEEIIPWSPIDVPQGPQNGLRLTVQTAGNQINIFVNDQEVESVRDNAFEQGYVGFIVSGAERAIFRDLVVEQVP